ncbi:MAG: thiamine-phosphate kinase, partial [Phycisphaerales bacterium]|nr:thiamine-phosphate kinase [Phycisphaerales bacterium]
MKEFELLQYIYSSSQTQDNQVIIGPGDDMAFLSIANQPLLAGVDQLIVGIHLAEDTPPDLIGRKVVARSFSDIAAMGGTPVASLMTAAMPPKTDNSWAISVFEGAQNAARKWGGAIVGGDIASTTVSTPPSFTVTALATPPHCGPARRTAAKLGDNIFVTGTLGNSLAEHHLSFTPRIEEAKLLFDAVQIHAMIDISDGLGQDASHLATDSLQLVIDSSLLPLREGANIMNALSDGEDYELL